MRHLAVCGILLIIFGLSCWWVLTQDTLSRTESINITYTVLGKSKSHMIMKPSEVERAVCLFRVQSRVVGSIKPKMPAGIIEFKLRNSSQIKMKVFSAPEFEEIGRGRVILRTTEFYDYICQLLLEVEGKPIDLASDNEFLEQRHRTLKELIKKGTEVGRSMTARISSRGEALLNLEAFQHDTVYSIISLDDINAKVRLLNTRRRNPQFSFGDDHEFFLGKTDPDNPDQGNNGFFWMDLTLMLRTFDILE